MPPVLVASQAEVNPLFFVPHIVYLAQSDDKIKVGITRKQNVPSRWIDQGAIQALPIIQASTRRAVGILEQVLAESLADKTNWRKMLTTDLTRLDLWAVRKEILSTLSPQMASLLSAVEDEAFVIESPTLYEISYPLTDSAPVLKSIDLMKVEQYEGQLLGLRPVLDIS